MSANWIATRREASRSPVSQRLTPPRRASAAEEILDDASRLDELSREELAPKSVRGKVRRLKKLIGVIRKSVPSQTRPLTPQLLALRREIRIDNVASEKLSARARNKLSYSNKLAQVASNHDDKAVTNHKMLRRGDACSNFC